MTSRAEDLTKSRSAEGRTLRPPSPEHQAGERLGGGECFEVTAGWAVTHVPVRLLWQPANGTTGAAVSQETRGRPSGEGRVGVHPEYEDEAVELVIKTRRPVAVVARELGILESTPGRGVHVLRAHQDGACVKGAPGCRLSLVTGTDSHSLGGASPLTRQRFEMLSTRTGLTTVTHTRRTLGPC